jgi:hypothetical protein
MNMCLVIDQLAQRYGCLPSKFLAEGDITDVAIMIKSITWHNEYEARSSKGMNMPRVTNYSTEQLLDMMARARGQNDNKS